MSTSQGQRGSLLVREWPLLVGLGTAALFFVFGSSWFANLGNLAWLAVLFVWLFAVMLLSATAVVRHAESLAAKLGEPLGTLILTLSVTGIEVMMISSVMFTGALVHERFLLGR
jgi:Ca2+:H+ antiporter